MATLTYADIKAFMSAGVSLTPENVSKYLATKTQVGTPENPATITIGGGYDVPSVPLATEPNGTIETSALADLAKYFDTTVNDLFYYGALAGLFFLWYKSR